MILRNFLLFFTFIFLFASNAFSAEKDSDNSIFKLEKEPLVRIGLLRNSSVVTISTRDNSLVSKSDGNTRKYLGTQRVRISLRSYRTPVYAVYRFEISNIETQEEAEELAKQIREKTNEKTLIMAGNTVDTWKIKIGGEIGTLEEANELKAFLTENEFENVKMITEKYKAPSDDSIDLSGQIPQTFKSHIRSLKEEYIGKSPKYRQPNSSVRKKNAGVIIRPGLREITVSGTTSASKFSTLRVTTIGTNSAKGIVYLNGKRYRGKMEIFVNKKGRLTVVNVVPMEDYLLGVVPAELSLPQIEAQKAQAVAARTYAVANKNNYGEEGFDMLPTVWSQVYKGVGIESRMGSQAVRETRGIYAAYRGTPINAMYTSTCGGRTENSGNIYEFDEPYLRGVNCSLDGREHFIPFLIKSSRNVAKIRNEANYELVRLASKFAVNGFVISTNQFDDDYFEDAPTSIELRSWLNQLSLKFGKPFPIVSGEDSAKPLKLARILHGLIYTPSSEENADALMSESDIEYQLSFLDAGEVPQKDRLILAELLRDGWFSIHSDLTIKPKKRYSRGKILRLIKHIYDKKKWKLSFESGEAKPTEDGKLILRKGRSQKEILVNPNVFLFRKFGDSFYQVKEAALIGGERITYKMGSFGEALYVEITPTKKTTVAERMSPFTTWRKTLSALNVRARLSRYVKGLGSLIDVRIKKKGFSRRATELEIVTTNGTHYLKGGKIRSALRLREQLFVINKRYGSNGRVRTYTFTGRGWGHGIGMCQYGAYGFAKMGLKYDQIVKHYYTDIDLIKAY